jgi:hypothetical protein
MSVRPRSSGPVVLLQGSLVAGAAYDIAFGLGILLMPGRLAGMLGIPMPADELYLRFLAIFLFGLALYYLLAASDPVAYRALAWVAVLVRVMGFVFLAGAVAAFGRPPVFLLLAAGDLAFALAHLAGLRTAPTPGSR